MRDRSRAHLNVLNLYAGLMDTDPGGQRPALVGVRGGEIVMVDLLPGAATEKEAFNCDLDGPLAEAGALAAALGCEGLLLFRTALCEIGGDGDGGVGMPDWMGRLLLVTEVGNGQATSFVYVSPHEPPAQALEDAADSANELIPPPTWIIEEEAMLQVILEAAAEETPDNYAVIGVLQHVNSEKGHSVYLAEDVANEVVKARHG